ncbi:hypothetical protein B9Z65_7709 [Elsinoe australis]|uniref:WLM domain-containing protein n=1 Tax=Elsinoe australis TaxID=40998 RepID=A0A2P8A0A3_9PEZI|nr:hypothetical protein B9Z65_7709 [Elsinoe australis]
MPLNTLRLNQKHLHPNERITFIKPLPNLSTTAKAELFLQKIAAQCYPIMKAHSLSITTLEEFAPNREFMGRNFNGGEVIQLVLRRMPIRKWDGQNQRFVSQSDLGENGVVVRGNQGRLDPHSTEFVAEREGQDDGWLDFRAVQAVMMHELAHCIEMNHSKAFWKVRNVYYEHLKVLWGRNYTGEGVWGRGQQLENGMFERGGGGGTGDFQDLCGGAYRGRGRRKRGKKGKEKVTYAERKKRKLEKVEGKFGKGKSVGESEAMKVMLEGKFKGSKPKVAGSKRGRDLRAAAALARFEKDKVEKEEEAEAIDEDETASESGSETESEPEECGVILVDAQGKQIKDGKGNGLYKVCDDTDAAEDPEAKNELAELENLVYRPRQQDNSSRTGQQSLKASPEISSPSRKLESTSKEPITIDDDEDDLDAGVMTTSTAPSKSTTTNPKACPICSLENEPGSATCIACAHVLDRSRIPGSWQCSTGSCKESAYVNAGDAGRCGICGQSKKE